MIVKDEPVPSRMALSAPQRALLEERLQRATQVMARQGESRSSIPRRTASDPLPLSFAQERLWFLDQLEPGSPVYNVCQAVRMNGTLDLGALEKALNEIVRRHEILRTNFVAVDGQPAQVISPERVLPLPVAELPAAPAERLAADLQRRLQEESRRPFDLARDLLVRALLLRTSPTEHTLLVTMHHIISDGWSIGILFRELAEIYTAQCAGMAATLPALPVQFADYVLWEREQVQGPSTEKALAYWKERLGGALPVLELPFDHGRPARPSSRGGMEIVQFSRALTQSIKSLAQQESATLFMTLLAAFQVLLHRCTGQADIVVGSVVAGRRKVELEKLIGFFVNTLVFRGDLSGDPTFIELLARTRATSLGAFAHQDLPFERLVKELRPDRAASRNPLFQVMFVLQNAPMAPAELPRLTLAPIEVNTGTAKFDLTLAMIESPDGLRAAFEYNADLFDAGTMARLLGCFQTLLESIAAQPEERVSRLPLLTPAERHALLSGWNETQRPFPRDTPVHVLVEQQVARAPHAIALECGAQTMTYGELNARANQLARRLGRLGVGPDTLVALCLERLPEMIVALLAILKAGAAYVSLDPSYPAERLAFMLADTQAPVVLTVTALQRVLPAATPSSALHVVRLDADWPSIAEEDTINLPPRAGAESLAYVSYTSGSTGRPKGVCVEHRAINRLLLNTDYVQLTPEDAVAQVANCAFDASTFEVWGALLNGARLVIVPSAVVLATREFAATVRERGVTALFLTTALFNQLAETEPEFFRPLRHVLFGGEAANPACVRAVVRRGFGCRLLHVYGPTETTTFATWHEVRAVSDDAVTIPIGRPIANTTAYVLDAQLQPVPIGVPGELYIGGDGVARGYLNRPEMTAQRFVANPFVEAAGRARSRLYRTGDRVRWRPDGTLEFLGRFDRQVKIRGFRIEPEEVELALQGLPDVSQAAVVVREVAAQERQLVAYVAPVRPRDEVRRHLQARLPDYMVPAVFVFLDALPLNANGKVDRNALPAAAEHTERPAYCAPRDATERELAGIWQAVLRVENAGVHDGFFDLGGHSLLAVRMVAEIAKKFGQQLPVAAIFQHGTIEQLARLLRPSGERYASGTSIVAIQSQGRRPALFLVHGVGGGMFWGYSNLARHLGPEQPVCAFKSRGLDGLPEWPTIEEMAAHYAAELRAQQPRGPYLIGGYCFGGVVAYEMAQQLKAQGESVALLALMNCSPANTSYLRPPVPRTAAWRLRFVRNIAYWLGCFLFKWTLQERVEFMRWKARLLQKRSLRPWLPNAPELTVTDVDEMVNLAAYSEDQRRLWQTHVKALRAYHPKPYDGHVTLFRTRGHPLVCSFDDSYGWGELARRGVAQSIVPGGHGNILDEPHVRTVARELERALRDAVDGRAAARPGEPSVPGRDAGTPLVSAKEGA